METIELEKVDDIKKATEREWRAMHGLSLILMREELPDDPPMPFEEWLADLQSSPSYRQTTCWLAWDGNGEDLIGSSSFTRKYLDENRHIGLVNVAIRPEERGRRLAAPLLLPAVEAAEFDGRSLCEGYVFDGGPGVGFANAVGSKTTILEYHNRLVLAELDVSMLGEWVERVQERASEYSLLLREGSWLPDERARAAELRMVMNTAPRPDSQEDEKTTPEMIAEWDAIAEAQGYVPWNYVARHDPTGEWVGLTRMWPSIFRKEFAYQDDTAVRVEHRNRGLGRWLKAAMLLKLKNERPATRWVDTENATTNEAMLNINRALGFKEVLVWQTREIPTRDLLGWLRNRV